MIICLFVRLIKFLPLLLKSADNLIQSLLCAALLGHHTCNAFFRNDGSLKFGNVKVCLNAFSVDIFKERDQTFRLILYLIYVFVDGACRLYEVALYVLGDLRRVELHQSSCQSAEVLHEPGVALRELLELSRLGKSRDFLTRFDNRVRVVDNLLLDNGDRSA